nr:OmpH family outer membrane protein [Pontibacter vulgaris]
MAATMFACNNQPKTAATGTTAGETTTEAPKEGIVYVNSDSLLANYDYFKDVRTRLQGKSKKAEQDLQSKAGAFQKEVAQYQQAAAGMSAEQRAATEQRLSQKQQQLAALNQNAGNELASEEGEEMKKIYDKVESYLKDHSKENGYKMVLTYSRGNSAILYSDSTLDITSAVVKGLNEQYKKEKDQPKEEAKKK